MNQSSFIAATLLAGFVLYLAAKNRLTAYTSVLWGANVSAATAAPTGSAANYAPLPGGGTNNTVFGMKLPSGVASVMNWTPSLGDIGTLLTALGGE